MPDASTIVTLATAASLLGGAAPPPAGAAPPAVATARVAGLRQALSPLPGESIPADTLPDDTATSPRDSATRAHAAELDSLRQRMAELRAELFRLRMEFGARIQRARNALWIEMPTSVRDVGDPPDLRTGGEGLERVASLARRYYTGARLTVVGGSSGGGGGCGTDRARRRVDAAVRRLTGPGGLPGSRVRRAPCDRIPTRDSAATDRPRVPDQGVVTLIIDFGGV